MLGLKWAYSWTRNFQNYVFRISRVQNIWRVAPMVTQQSRTVLGKNVKINDFMGQRIHSHRLVFQNRRLMRKSTMRSVKFIVNGPQSARSHQSGRSLELILWFLVEFRVKIYSKDRPFFTILSENFWPFTLISRPSIFTDNQVFWIGQFDIWTSF